MACGGFKEIIGVVLAGGEGKRLRPLTYYFQKCMIPIGTRQKPLLEYILHHLKRHGITDIRLLVGYKHEQIKNYFDDGSRFGMRVGYFLDDPSLRGSGGALLKAAEKGAFDGAETLLVYYGDILSNIDLSRMLRQHLESRSSSTLALARGFEVPVGVAELEGRSIKRWVEKPRLDIYAGIGIVALNTHVIGDLRELAAGRDELDIMGDLIPHLIKKGRRVEAYVTEDFWYDVGSTEKYEKLNSDLIEAIFDI
ncbi:MAG: nucleotidyltransferase family protein [Candidatus Bathyarchaeia archaeon]|nr:nucleotidyltransferase family protein [Candidatus Bathyarchaeota archaeon]